MKNKKGVLVSAVMTLLLANNASFAGNVPGAITVSLAAAYYNFSEKHHIKDTAMPNIAISYNFDDHWAIEGLFGVLNTNTKDSDDDDSFFLDEDSNHKDSVHGLLYTIDGIYRFTPHAHFEPYVIAGIGVLGLKPNGDDSTQSGNINGGLGAQLFFGPTVALRGEVRDIYTTTGSYKNDVMVNLGVSFVFGGAPCVTPVYKV